VVCVAAGAATAADVGGRVVVGAGAAVRVVVVWVGSGTATAVELDGRVTVGSAGAVVGSGCRDRVGCAPSVRLGRAVEVGAASGSSDAGRSMDRNDARPTAGWTNLRYLGRMRSDRTLRRS
jgi:hypothetical protein